MSNPLPSELKQDIKQVLEDTLVYTLEMRLDEDIPSMADDLAELFEQEYQCRIKAAKPKAPKESADALINAAHAGYNIGIYEYEDNLKQLSEGEK